MFTQQIKIKKEEKMKKIIPLLIFLSFIACTSSQKEDSQAIKVKAQQHNVLRIGITQEFDSMNPILMQMSAATYISAMVNRGLMVLNSQNEWVPQIIKQIPTLKNKKAEFFYEEGVKKIKAHFEILDEIKWGDGTPVTGHDVVFTWKTALLDTVAIGERELYSQIEKIFVAPTNSKKFTFFFKKAKWDYNQLGQFRLLPQHMEEEIVKKYGKKPEGYSKNSKYASDYTQPGLYNGPYKITEMKRGSHVTVEENPHFYGKKPYFKKIIIKIIPNTATLEANLRSNTIDMLSFIGFKLDQALQFKKKVAKNNLPYNVNIRSSLIYEHIDLNLTNPILKNKKLRKALVYSIDRDQLTKALFDNIQQKAIHNLSPNDPWFTKDSSKIVLYPTSKKKAKKLLDEAGWHLGKDSYRYRNGKKLNLTIMSTAGDKTRELVEVFLQKEWKEVGIDVQIKNEVAKVFFGATIKRRLKDKPTLTMYAWLSSPESSPRSQLHSKSIPSSQNGFSGQNYPKWSHKEVDRLIDQLELEFDFNKRKEISHKILYYYTDEVPVIPLYYRSDISVTPTGLTGYALNGNQFSPTNFIESWRFETR